MIASLHRNPLRCQSYAFTKFTHLIRKTSDLSRLPTAKFTNENTSEELIEIPAYQGYGYFKGGPGLSLGPSNRFKLQSKLGFGTTSSVWLAHDSVDDTHVAIKIFSESATKLSYNHRVRELEVLQRLSLAASESESCPRLLAHFIHPSLDEDGDHLCLVKQLFMSDIRGLPAIFEDGFLPVPLVKRILKDVLMCLVHLHSCGIAHTEVQPDNIMMGLSCRWTTDAINKWVLENPPSTYPPELDYSCNGKMVSAYRSQSFPLPTIDELSTCNFKLADFGSAQILNEKTTSFIRTPVSLSPPEALLGVEWNESVDIWTLGCLVFTLLTRQALFQQNTLEQANGSNVDGLLSEMLVVSGESFQTEFLKRCINSRLYFDRDGRLNECQELTRETVDQSILSTGCALSPTDFAGATDFMGKCLRLDPKHRATAAELLEHPWLIR